MGITQMLQALGNNDTLENLGLHTNNLQDEGAEAIANYMAGWPCTSSNITYTGNILLKLWAVQVNTLVVVTLRCWASPDSTTLHLHEALVSDDDAVSFSFQQ